MVRSKREVVSVAQRWNSCPYANSFTIREILAGKGKTISHGSVKLGPPPPWARGGVLPFAMGRIWLMGVPTAHPFWAQASPD